MIYWLQESSPSAPLIGAVVGAVVGLVGVLIGQVLQQRRHSQTLRITEQGQITDRFIRALDQIGARDDKGNIQRETRLGAIYALGQIIRDLPSVYGGPILEVLTAYIRDNAIKDNDPYVSDDKASKYFPPLPPPLPADIQAALYVIGRPKDPRIPEEERVSDFDGIRISLDLRETNLQSADLANGDFEEATFFSANLQWASLNKANIRRAIFVGADLRRVDLRGADLRGAILIEAVLEQADLGETNLKGADLRGAFLYNAENLTQEQINSANGDEDTQLPDHLQRPTHW